MVYMEQVDEDDDQSYIDEETHRRTGYSEDLEDDLLSGLGTGGRGGR